MESTQENMVILQEAEKRLRRLSPQRLRVVSDFLAYLEEREENEATAELLSIPGFEQTLREAMQQAQAGEVVPFDSIRRDV
jgi:PHD/YefM family antitoxin component YafN of YafNO toxin-antitoxin module